MPNDYLPVLQEEEATIRSILPSYINADRWWALAVELSKSASLRDCWEKNPMSVIAALKQIADWGLELDGDEAIIIPYRDQDTNLPTAQAQAMYKGLIRRAIDARVAVHIYAELVREGELVEIVSGSHRELKHIPNPFAAKKPVVGAYAVAILANGVTDFEIFTADDIAACKAAGLRMAQRRNRDAKDSPAWRFFEGEMVKKSVIRRLCKRLRGARDTDEGRRYAGMMKVEQRFDVETEATNPGELTEEETPRAKTLELVPDDGGTDPLEAGNTDPEEQPASAATGGDALSAEEKALVEDIWTKAPGTGLEKMTRVRKGGLPHYVGRDKLKASEVGLFAKALQ